MGKNRESNIELLRIVAMFMILGLHVNKLAIGLPDKTDFINCPVTSFMRIFFEQVCIIGVNIFVLISGWFGIRYKTKGLCNFLFQSLFFSILLFIPFLLIGYIELNIKNVLSAFLLYKNAYWFVWAYLILYILSPVLNSFIDNAEKHIYRNVLILFFTTQTIVHFFTPCDFFDAGYTPLSFIGLYLLMRYIRKYHSVTKKRTLLIIWLLYICTNLVICHTENISLIAISLAYVNPLNIIGAVAFVLLFTKISIKSSFINSIAASSFAVYLLHMHFCIITHYKAYALTIFNKNGGGNVRYSNNFVYDCCFRSFSFD